MPYTIEYIAAFYLAFCITLNAMIFICYKTDPWKDGKCKVQNKSRKKIDFSNLLYLNCQFVNLLYLIGVPTPVRVGMLEALWIEPNLKNVVNRIC